jgi:hypothetical protein
VDDYRERTNHVGRVLDEPCVLDRFLRACASGNKPPVVRFAANGPELAGPPSGSHRRCQSPSVSPLPLKLWASDARAAKRRRGRSWPRCAPAAPGIRAATGDRRWAADRRRWPRRRR